MNWKPNAKEIILKAWSIRWMAAAFIFTALEVCMPFLEGWLPVPRPLFGVLSGVCTAMAFASRLHVQNNLAG